ncbi:Histone-Lysine N-Methyltransferase ash1l [Actinomortierella ambigua]|nr:Histone-Lysine N-Methyltransferase ash1l [Actinomortierella ambigua]
MVCHCKRPPPEAGVVGCGEDCYNRVMFYECVSAHCPCGDQCSNQRFQRKNPNEDHLEVIWTEERGFGIRTTKPIKRGSLVIEYRGEVISQKLCLERMEGMYKNNKNFYFLEYEKGEVVDACLKGTNARFVNHSCSPNSQIEKWFLNGEMSIGIFASQDIPAMTEITYDYNFSSFSGAHLQQCRCGSANCRGYIGARSQGARLKEMSNEALEDGPNGSSYNTHHSHLNGNGNGSGHGANGRGGPGRKGRGERKKALGRHKANNGSHWVGRGGGGIDDHQTLSVRYSHLPTIKTTRQRQSDKYKENKTMAIRYTKLFLFRNIRRVESKYVRYARTKSRGFMHGDSESRRAWLAQAQQGRKRSLEGVMEDLRLACLAKEQEEQLQREAEEEARGRLQAEQEALEHAAARVAAAEMAAAVGSAGETDSCTTGSVEPSEVNYGGAVEGQGGDGNDVEAEQEEEEEEEEEEEVDQLQEEDEDDDKSTPAGYASAVSQLKRYLNRELGLESDGESEERRGGEGPMDQEQEIEDEEPVGEEQDGEDEEEEEVDELADDDGEDSLQQLREALLKKAQAGHSSADEADGDE